MEGVDGASYDGFYYIVHDQVTGNIQGFYYHQDARKVPTAGIGTIFEK